jgi:hypothetical protein
MAIDSESFRELRACPACHAEALGGGGSAVEWVKGLYPSRAKAKLLDNPLASKTCGVEAKFMSGHHYRIASRARNPSLTEFPRAAREGIIKVTTIVRSQQTFPSSLKCSRLAGCKRAIA